MRIIPSFLLILLMVAFSSIPTIGQELYVYPKDGQSKEQMEKDKYDCHLWAKKETGFDPHAPIPQKPTSSQVETSSGSVGKKVVGGAMVGGIAGSLGGKAGQGAAVGAATGGLVGGVKQRNSQNVQRQAEQQQAEAQAAALNQKRAEFNRAFTACMEAKNYTIK